MGKHAGSLEIMEESLQMNLLKNTYKIPRRPLPWRTTLSLGSLLLSVLFLIACQREKPTNPSTTVAEGQTSKIGAHHVVETDGSDGGPSNRCPSKVTLSTPENNTIFRLCSTEQELIFTWCSSTDPDGDVVGYMWFLINVEDNQTLLWEDTGQDTFYVLDGLTVSHLFPENDFPYDVNWKVRTTDGRATITSDESGVTFFSLLGKSYTVPSDFPVDFFPPEDQLTGTMLGGWGGSEGCVIHTPIVFLHGNGHTADTWNLVAQRFLENGYFPRELWAISYIDFFGGDSANSNMANVEDIEQFINGVLDYTGVESVDLIAHSLGVTVARAWLEEKDAHGKIEHFIAIAGPNHGVNFCFGPQAGTALCREIGHPDSDFLYFLNDPDETPLDDFVTYITIYDGTGADIFYPATAMFSDGSTGNLLDSPRLKGATNVQLPGEDHFQLKDSQESFDLMFDFLNTNGSYVQY